MGTYQYLLDTNILSELIKHPAGLVAQKIIKMDEDAFCTSIIVACELRYGAKKKKSRQLTRKIDLLLANIVVQPLSEEVDYYYATLRAALEHSGQPIGANDMLIAAHALSLNLTLVTANEREFLRVPRLKLENWLK